MLRLSVIHNYDEVRANYIYPAIRNLVSSLKNESVQVHKIGYQPPLVPHSLAKRVGRRISQRRLALRMMFTLEIPRKVFVFTHWIATLPIDVFAVFASWMKKSKKSAVEEILTIKHVRAWLDFLDSDDHMLCVLEDDAVFVDEANQRLHACLSRLLETNSKGYVVSISDYFSLAELWLENDVAQTDDVLIEFKHGAVNGTGGYLLNRLAASLFVDCVSRTPALMRLNSDFLINSLLLKLNDQVFCAQTKIPIIMNGSASGQFSTLIEG